MNMYLLDTNVVSELRKPIRKHDPKFKEWLEATSLQTCFISVITLYELRKGMLSIARRDAKQGNLLARWIDELRKSYRNNTLSIDPNVAIRAAELAVPDPRPLADCLIAATALTHDLVLVTRNTRDFAIANLVVIDPWG